LALILCLLTLAGTLSYQQFRLAHLTTAIAETAGKESLDAIRQNLRSSTSDSLRSTKYLTSNDKSAPNGNVSIRSWRISALKTRPSRVCIPKRKSSRSLPLGETSPVESIDRRSVLGWRRGELERGLAKQSWNTYSNHLRTVWGYAIEHGT
jgi:hypothetical protein